jgi:hypothetical protein
MDTCRNKCVSQLMHKECNTRVTLNLHVLSLHIISFEQKKFSLYLTKHNAMNTHGVVEFGSIHSYPRWREVVSVTPLDPVALPPG